MRDETISKSPDFEFPEDRDFFSSLLEQNTLFADHFDFSDPTEKRRAFDKLKKRVMGETNKQGRMKCELQLVADCDSSKLVLDHMIPLSSNELNKHLRKMVAPVGKKVPAQSFGANNIANFIVACEKCNQFKKHRFVKKKGDKWIILNIKKQYA